MWRTLGAHLSNSSCQFDSVLQNTFIDYTLLWFTFIFMLKILLTTKEQWSNMVRGPFYTPSSGRWERWSGWFFPNPFHRPGCHWGCYSREILATPNREPITYVQHIIIDEYVYVHMHTHPHIYIYRIYGLTWYCFSVPPMSVPGCLIMDSLELWAMR